MGGLLIWALGCHGRGSQCITLTNRWHQGGGKKFTGITRDNKITYIT